MNVFITGINGFIGSALARALLQQSHRVIGTVSSKEKLASVAGHSTKSYVLRINEEFDREILQGIDVLVHCAYDLRKGKSVDNIEGTKKLVQAAIEQGVKWQIYVGSYSAHENAVSEYGRTKLELEKLFLSMGQIVVKPGLVVGNGGIFLKMSDFVRKFPVAPLIDGGRGKLTIVSIADLTSAFVQLIENPRPGCFRLYNDEQVTFKEVLVQVKRAGGFNTILVPVPGQLILAGLWMAEKLKLPIQVDAGNLKGFQANQSVQPTSDLRQFVSHPMALTEMIATLRQQ
ncbi:MAG TPA: NAD-dependent epimerase/dehydratase family protein [Pyrinomonadaceae bacterium]|nr:NAD-dependent epimerase/dehydratase family protein [Pyrinomonadaceae bacterium]